MKVKGEQDFLFKLGRIIIIAMLTQSKLKYGFINIQMVAF